MLFRSNEEVTGDVVDELPSESDSEDVVIEESSETDDLEGLSTQEMIDKLSKEAGLPVKESSESEETVVEESSEEETTGTVHEIVIETLSVSPADVSIKVGDTVRWIDNHKNYKHIIVIRSMDDGTYRDQVTDPIVLLYGETGEFTFEKAGKYDYYSKPAYDSVNGDIVVTE